MATGYPLWVGQAADGDEAVGAVGGAAVVDENGVAVGGLAVVALNARGGRGARVGRPLYQQLVGVVALLEEQALGVGAVLRVVFHAAEAVEPPIGEGADDVDGAVEHGLRHRQAEVDPHVVGLEARVVAVPDVDFHAAVEGGGGDVVLGRAVFLGAQNGEGLAAVVLDADDVVHGGAEVATVEVAEVVASVEDVLLSVAVGEAMIVVAAEGELAEVVEAAVLLHHNMHVFRAQL